jgi:flavin reductase (DIM6/NTAB) family NADH-FMN oxidoreductase RutF
MTTEAFNQRAFRNTLGRFATGVTIITVLEGEETHGMTANAFVSVSLDPPLVLVSLDNRSHMHRFLSIAMRYGVSVLAEDQRALSDHFAGRTTEDTRIHFVSRAGTALLHGAIAYFVVRVEDVHPAGDHTLYVGSVEYFESRDDKPLVFYAGRYRQLLVRRLKPLPLSIVNRWIRSVISSLSAGWNSLNEYRRRAGSVLKAALRIVTHGRY